MTFRELVKLKIVKKAKQTINILRDKGEVTVEMQGIVITGTPELITKFIKSLEERANVN